MNDGDAFRWLSAILITFGGVVLFSWMEGYMTYEAAVLFILFMLFSTIVVIALIVYQVFLIISPGIGE